MRTARQSDNHESDNSHNETAGSSTGALAAPYAAWYRLGMGALRTTLVPVGFVLVLLGLGNWWTGHDKVAEHERLLAAGNIPARVEQFDEFPELTSRTNATLLHPLQAGDDARSVIKDKLDFYRVLLTGGRILVLLGLFISATGLIHSWYRNHLRSLERDLAS